MFKPAAENGMADAQYNLALLHVAWKNIKSALYWLEKAASRGHPMANYDLAFFYAEGNSVKQDYKRAAALLARAAAAGVASAQAEYGIWLFNGKGTAKDEAKGARYIRLAAEQNNPVAQNRLSRLHAHGIAVAKNKVEAAKWHLLARKAGISDGRMDIFLSRLTKSERMAAEKAAADWHTAGAIPHPNLAVNR
jgi:TPR repeat protein